MRVLGEWDWWYSQTATVLHSASVECEPGFYAQGNGVTACGRKLWLMIPGFLSRMSLPRCQRCCRALEYPPGIGSPKNDNRCRPLVKKRLAERRLKNAN